MTNNRDVTITVSLTITDYVMETTATEQFISYHYPLMDCVVAGTDNVWIGYERDVFGEIDEGEETTFVLYSIKWREDTTEFRIEIGDGTEQIPDTELVHLAYQNKSYQLIWDGLGYQTIDAILVGDLAEQYAAGVRDFCFVVAYLPNLAIQVDFQSLQTKETV